MSSPAVVPQDESPLKTATSFRRQLAWAAAAAVGLAVGLTAVVLLTQNNNQATSPSLRASMLCRSAIRLDVDGSVQVPTNLLDSGAPMPPPGCAATTEGGSYYQMMAPATGHYQAAPGVVVVNEVTCQCVASDGCVQAQDVITFWTSMKAPDMPYMPVEFVAEDTDATAPEDGMDGADEQDGSEASPPASEDNAEDNIPTIVGPPTNTHCYLADPLLFDAHIDLGDSLADQSPTMDQMMNVGCDLNAAAVFYDFTADDNTGSMSVDVVRNVGDGGTLVSVWRGTGCEEELVCEGQDFNSVTWSVNHPHERFVVAIHKLSGDFDLHVWKQWQD
jgi:hypothetical protein